MQEKSNLIGAILTHVIYGLCILIFLSRLREKPRIEYWAGLLLLLKFPARLSASQGPGA